MNKSPKLVQQQPSCNEEQQETDIIRKRFELYDSLFSKFEEKISKIEGAIKKKPSISLNTQINNLQQISLLIYECKYLLKSYNIIKEERSQNNTPSNSSMNSSIKRFEDKILDLKVQFEKKFLSQEEKFKAIMNRLERYEAVQELYQHYQKIDQEIKLVETNSNLIIQNVNNIDEKVVKLDSTIKILKSNGLPGNTQGSNSNRISLNLTEEFRTEITQLNNMFQQCNSNFKNLHNSVKKIEKQIEKSPSKQNGNTPTQNKKKNRINGVVDENDKPLLTFQDTNRKFFGEQSSSKKLGEKLLNQEESQDKHLISYHNSPNFASSNTSPLNRKQPLQQIQNINQQQILLLSLQQQQAQQHQIVHQQRIHQQNGLQQKQNLSSQRICSHGSELVNNNNSNIIHQNNYIQHQNGNKTSQNKISTNNQTIFSNQPQSNYSQLNNSSCISSIKKNLNEEFETKRTGRSNSVHDNVLQGVTMKNIEIEPPQFSKQFVKYDYYFENNSTKSNRYSSSNISSNSPLNAIPCQNENLSPNLVQKRQSLKPPMNTHNQKYNEGSQQNLCLNQEQMIHMHLSNQYTPSSNVDHINRSFAYIEEKKRKIDEEIEKRIREESQKRDKIIGTVDVKTKIPEQLPINAYQEVNKQFKHTPKGTQQSRTKEMQNRLSLERKVKDEKIMQFEKQAIGTKKQNFDL